MEITPLIMDSVTIVSAGTMMVLAFHYMASILADKSKIDLDYHG